MKEPAWLSELRQKISRIKKTSALICLAISLMIAIIFLFIDPELALIVGLATLGGLFLLVFPFIVLNTKLRVRHYNGNIIVLYNTIPHGRLYINGTLFDEGGLFDYTLYGQLPTGEEVVVKADAWSGNISFHIGSANNNQSINLS